MSIQKKSLISNLNATKKANVANASQPDLTPGTKGVKAAKMSKAMKLGTFKNFGTVKNLGRLGRFGKI